MEWSWRTVLIIIGLLAMVAILIDGFRRMRRARAEALRLDVSNEFRFPDDGHNPELPGGGFRVLGGTAKAEAVDEDDYVADDATAVEEESGETAFADEYSDLNEEQAEATPAIKEPAQKQAEAKPVIAKTPADRVKTEQEEMGLPSFSARDELDDALVAWEDDISPVRIAREAGKKPHPETIKDFDIPQSRLIPKARPVNLDEEFPVLLDVEELGDDDVQPEEPQQPVTGDLFARADEEEKEIDNTMLSDELSNDEYPDEEDLEQEVEEVPEFTGSQPINFAAADAEKLSDRSVPDMVLEIHCIAHEDQGFAGKDILYLFNSCDLRFGEKDIFHRFEQADGRGKIQFSVAQSFEPGVFVPAAMAQQHFRGLSFFMSLPGPDKPQDAYDAMSEMARVIARNLKADLYDGARSALTMQTMEHDRQQIMDYERRQKLARKKQSLKK